MRHTKRKTSDAEALEILDACHVVQVAWVDDDGRPDIRSLHAARLGRSLYIHGAPGGAKAGAVDRWVTVSGEEIIARIPSHFIDPERACPATTYYRSVHVRGRLTVERDPERRAAALEALMRAMQPEGGYRPITAEDPLYAKVLDGLLIGRVEIEQIVGRRKMGQTAPTRVPRVLAGLWGRGAPGDLRAIERIRAVSPRATLPPALASPLPGVSLHVWRDPADRAPAMELLVDAYWNAHLPPPDVERGWAGAPAWIGARGPDGALIASAGAMSDGRRGWISDVVVHPDWRGRGLGQALMRAMLDHPALRSCVKVGLRTRDAQPFYRALGFVEASAGPFPATELWFEPSAAR